MTITITDDAGHPIVCPLWKFPQLVAFEVEKKRDVIAKVKADQAAAEAEKFAAEEAKRQEEIRLADSLNTPFDLSVAPEFG